MARRTEIADALARYCESNGFEYDAHEDTGCAGCGKEHPRWQCRLIETEDFDDEFDLY